MSILALGIFIVATSIHLYASWKKNVRLRAMTKPYILLSLLWWYILVCEEPSTTLILALIFSWIGDMFLIGPGVKFFSIGGVAFLISHLFFIISYSKDIVFDNYIACAIIELVFLIAVCIIFSKLKPHLPKILFFPMAVYLLLNGTMNCAALLRMITNPCAATIVTCIGAFMFFISDSSLFFVRFKKNCIIKTHFIVMLTYSIGEFLIILGMIPNIFQ